VDANKFYAVSVTASDHRFSIRSFQSLSLEEVIERTNEYFDRQRLVRYGERQTYSLFSLLEAAAPLTTNQSTGGHEPDREQLPPRFADALVEHVLTGQALPKSLRDRALRRCRAEHATAPTPQDDRRRVDYAVPVHRAALLKLFLSSQPDEPMPEEQLDREHPDPAYHCGRYLAVADSVYYATSDAENYVSKRYYSSASTTPASVMGRVIPNVQHQLDKLQRDQPGRATNLDKEITQIMNQIDDFPKTLQPNRQARFALGFYHQRDHEMTSSTADDD
jgi:CRISPR-associated protein Csd1